MTLSYTHTCDGANCLVCWLGGHYRKAEERAVSAGAERDKLRKAAQLLAHEAARACTEPRRFHENEDDRQQELSQAVAKVRLTLAAEPQAGQEPGERIPSNVLARLRSIVADWRTNATKAEDAMERVVLNVCADTLDDALSELAALREARTRGGTAS